MDNNNEMRLRLRFYKDVSQGRDEVLAKFESFRQSKSEDFSLKTRGYHIWLDIKEPKKTHYSPHLHLELESKEDKGTHIRALFGPDPTLWTLFMFLHFMVAGVFLIFSVIAYSDYVLKKPVTMDLVIMNVMVCVWFLLYYIARQVRRSGNEQMNQLDKLFHRIIES